MILQKARFINNIRQSVYVDILSYSFFFSLSFYLSFRVTNIATPFENIQIGRPINKAILYYFWTWPDAKVI